jgi:hypothetical protein
MNYSVRVILYHFNRHTTNNNKGRAGNQTHVLQKIIGKGP